MGIVSQSQAAPLSLAQQRLCLDPDALLMVKRLAIRIGRRYAFSISELRAIGALALAEAARTFRSEEGKTFAQFSFLRVRGMMMNAVSGETSYRSHVASSCARFVGGERGEGDPMHDTEEDHRERLRGFSDGVVAAGAVGLTGRALAGASTSGEEEGTEALAMRAVVRAVHEVLATLTAKERGLIEMHYFEERSLEEAVQALDFANLAKVKRTHAALLKEKIARRLRARGVTPEIVESVL